MATKSKVKGRKGKLGKNKGHIAAYYSSCRYNWNKARRIAHHIQRYSPNRTDEVALTAIKVQLAAMPLYMSREFNAKY